jgi:predicted nucleic acid-binding protein
MVQRDPTNPSNKSKSRHYTLNSDHEFFKFQLENLGREVAELRVNSLLKLDLKIVDLNVPIAIEAAKLRCKYVELPTADAIIAATAILMDSDYVITDDKHIKQIKETKTKWI